MNFVTVTVYKRNHKKIIPLNSIHIKVKKHAYLSEMSHCNCLPKQKSLGRVYVDEPGKVERVRGHAGVWEVFIIFSVVIGFPGTYALTKCADFYF